MINKSIKEYVYEKESILDSIEFHKNISLEHTVQTYAKGDNLRKGFDFDFDVYLKNRKINLQRPLVWTMEQKLALIESIYMKRYIPPVVVIDNYDDETKMRNLEHIYRVVDGKQRLNAIISYMRGEFKWRGYGHNDNKETRLFFKSRLSSTLRFTMYYDMFDENMIVELFKRINYAGTPMDLEHIKKIS